MLIDKILFKNLQCSCSWDSIAFDCIWLPLIIWGVETHWTGDKIWESETLALKRTVQGDEVKEFVSVFAWQMGIEIDSSSVGTTQLCRKWPNVSWIGGSDLPEKRQWSSIWLD